MWVSDGCRWCCVVLVVLRDGDGGGLCGWSWLSSGGAVRPKPPRVGMPCLTATTKNVWRFHRLCHPAGCCSFLAAALGAGCATSQGCSPTGPSVVLELSPPRPAASELFVVYGASACAMFAAAFCGCSAIAAMHPLIIVRLGVVLAGVVDSVCVRALISGSNVA